MECRRQLLKSRSISNLGNIHMQIQMLYMVSFTWLSNSCQWQLVGFQNWQLPSGKSLSTTAFSAVALLGTHLSPKQLVFWGNTFCSLFFLYQYRRGHLTSVRICATAKHSKGLPTHCLISTLVSGKCLKWKENGTIFLLFMPSFQQEAV